MQRGKFRIGRGFCADGIESPAAIAARRRGARSLVGEVTMRLAIVFFAGLVGLMLMPARTFAQPQPESGEAAREESLSHVVQLTSGFEKAGEAYFSPDMKWIIFQATPKGQPQYQMFVAKLKWDGERIAGVEAPVQISPEPSRNTCGYFSPDGKSLIF